MLEFSNSNSKKVIFLLIDICKEEIEWFYFEDFFVKSFPRNSYSYFFQQQGQMKPIIKSKNLKFVSIKYIFINFVLTGTCEYESSLLDDAEARVTYDVRMHWIGNSRFYNWTVNYLKLSTCLPGNVMQSPYYWHQWHSLVLLRMIPTLWKMIQSTLWISEQVNDFTINGTNKYLPTATYLLYHVKGQFCPLGRENEKGVWKLIFFSHLHM